MEQLLTFKRIVVDGVDINPSQIGFILLIGRYSIEITNTHMKN